LSINGVLRSPASIFFGSGQRAALAEIVTTFGQRALVCSDERFLTDARLVEMAQSLRSAGIEMELYDRTLAELPLECITEASELARKFAPNVIVAVGGGSCIDLAKLVALSLAYPGDLSDFYGELKVPGPVLPVIAIPTTAGTGSEITPVAVLGDPQRKLKVGISSPHLIPRIALCDPELTLSCPAGLTAVAGADALTHAIEAFTAITRPYQPGLALRQVFIGKNSLSDQHAQTAIASLAGYLSQSVRSGDDLNAREQVMYGSMTAGLAFGVAGTAAAHALQYPVGALTKTAHGLGVAALMPYVMEYNRPAVLAEFVEIARQFGRTEGDNEMLASMAIDAVAALFADIGIPADLRSLGVEQKDLAWISEQSLLSARLVNNNPRQLDLGAMRQIAEAAFHGDRSRLRNS